MIKHLVSRKRIKIVFLIGQLTLGGSERQLYLLLRNFDLEQFEPIVVALNPSSDDVLQRALERCSVRVIELPKSCQGIFRRSWYLYLLFHQLSPQIIHSWTFHDNPYAGLIGFLAGIPVRFGSLRDSIAGKGFSNISGLFQYISLNSIHKLVVNASSIEDELISRGNTRSRIFLLNNCVEVLPTISVEYLKATLGIAPSAPIVAIVGNLRKKKNHLLFVEGMARIIPSFPDVVGLIIGQPLPGEEELPAMILARISELGLEGRVILQGFRSNVPELMHCFQVLCLISDYEGTPNVVLEAMAAACPVIATNVGDVPRLVQNGITGYSINVGDVEGLVMSVSKMLKNPEMAKKMGLAGQDLVRQEYGIEQAVHRLTTLYRDSLYVSMSSISSNRIEREHEE